MFQEDASGWQVFSYGKLGEVTENIRTFALPFESRPYTFRMKYKYDSFNRMQQMTYPDGEVVSYRYDTLLRLQHLFCMDALGDTLQNIDYIYDAVSNITDITNNSNVLANGLGGSYEGHYTYDNLYRLIRSDGNWGGTPNTSYELVMRYHRNGRILGKELSATTVRNNAYGNTIHTDWTYNYADGSNKLLEIRDAIQPWAQFFEWDGNGNMSMHKNISEGCIRWYCWDEENRMQGAADCNNASIYQYDANGDRTYKFTGRSVQQGENGGLHNYATLYDPTLYASSYVVCTPRGYTKHYYAESERVASKIGNGCLKELNKSVNIQANYNEKDDIENPYLSDYETLHEIVSLKEEDNKSYFKQVMECLGLSCDVKENTLEKLKKFVPCNDEIEKECYWYHPDHLGSSSWITFSDGSAVQHLHYLPWGEDFVDQRSTSWNAMHTFSSKERDTETGLSYFGARYYSSELSLWLSVDPMVDKYPSMSPYTYCANNPVKMVDPNGEEVHPVGEEEYKMILNTLPLEDRAYVQLDKNGYINKELMNSHDSESGNYNNLLTLVNNELTIDVVLSDCVAYVDRHGYNCEEGLILQGIDKNFINMDCSSDYTLSSTGETGNLGKTLFPGNSDICNSPDKNIKVYINKDLSVAGRAEIFSHEAYGHAGLYIESNYDIEKSVHIPTMGKDSNKPLHDRIVNAQCETIQNMR